MNDQNTPHPTIGMCPCESSQVKGHGYDAASRTLAVEFKSGGVYHYQDVPPEKYDAMKSAESVGKFIGASIKGAHQFTKITRDAK